jgi:uncharacterized repeat protein (TIGR01451 family)
LDDSDSTPDNGAVDEDDYDCANVPIRQVFDLSVKKELMAPLESYPLGSRIDYKITVTNEGRVDATNVKIADYVPEGLMLVNADDNETVLPLVAAGHSESITIPFKIKNSFQGNTISNCAEIASVSNAIHLADMDSTPANQHADEDDYDCADVNISHKYDLALVKTIENKKSLYQTGETVQYTITVYNQGSLDAHNIVVEDYIPTGLILEDSMWNQVGHTAVAKRTLDIPAGSAATQTITFRIDPNFQGNTLVNWAEIASDDGEDIDSNPSGSQCKVNSLSDYKDKNNRVTNTVGCDDIDPELIHIGQHFDLALIKKRLGALIHYSGDTVEFEITVYNQGTLDATQVQVNDYIPTGLILNDINWKEDNGVATLKTPIALIEHGKQKTVKISFKVDTKFKEGMIVNNAEIASATNALGQNDIDSVPASEDGKTPDDNDNDIADINGMDDYDSAIVKVVLSAVDSDTVKPKDVCNCNNIESNKANAVHWVTWILMLLGTWLMVARIAREEKTKNHLLKVNP